LLRRDCLLLLASLVVACRPEIGDKCVLSTDCSVRGDRQCDIAQPGGYCTQFNCKGDGCPDEASCVLFNSAIPGCAYDDKSGGFGSRVSRSFCERRCESQPDCREGYVCTKPQDFPWNAINLDNDQSPRVCLPIPPLGLDASAGPSTAPVCSAVGPATPPIDASPAQIFEAGTIPPITVDAGPQDAGDGG
jgi:hypothetical protein